MKTHHCQYIPGQLEQPWFEQKASGSICQLLATPLQEGGTRGWLEFANAARGRLRLMPSDQHVQLMSRFECEGENATFIEPLTGSARHPLADIRHWANTKHTLNGGRASGAKATNGRHKHCKLHGKEDAGLFNISPW